MRPSITRTCLTRLCLDGEALLEVAGTDSLLRAISAQLGDIPATERDALARALLHRVAFDPTTARLIASCLRKPDPRVHVHAHAHTHAIERDGPPPAGAA